MRRAVSAAAFCLLCQGAAFAKCADDWLAVDEVRTEHEIELLATNNSAYPLTFALTVDSVAGGNSTPRHFSDTLQGRQSERVLTVPRPADGQADPLSVSCAWSIGSRNAAHDDDHLYLLPYADGQSYRVLQGFDSAWSHRGTEQFAVDFKMPVGTPVHAARGGVVVQVRESGDRGCWDDACNSLANFIVILHDDGTTGEYYHLQKNGALVAVGERVSAGQQIGLSGNTGRSAAPHLHFAVYQPTTTGQSQSIPVSFISADGIIYRPRNGHHYFAVRDPHAGD